MPDSVGKRQRRDVKAKKAVAREMRRVARNKRREDRATDSAGHGQATEQSALEGTEDLETLPGWLDSA